MSRSVQIKVARPCHENWNNMTPDEQGRFCGACQQTVVDYTAMSDKELLDHISKTAGQHACYETQTVVLNKKKNWQNVTVSITMTEMIMGKLAYIPKGIKQIN